MCSQNDHDHTVTLFSHSLPLILRVYFLLCFKSVHRYNKTVPKLNLAIFFLFNCNRTLLCYRCYRHKIYFNLNFCLVVCLSILRKCYSDFAKILHDDNWNYGNVTFIQQNEKEVNNKKNIKLTLMTLSMQFSLFSNWELEIFVLYLYGIYRNAIISLLKKTFFSSCEASVII